MKRWLLSTDGGSTYPWQLNIVNGAEIQFSTERESDQVFMRTKMESDLVLDRDGFQLIYPFERNPDQRCAKLYVKQEVRCSGMWITRWTGRFTANLCSFDLDACQVTVKPETYDKYTCLLDKWEEKINVLDSPAYCVHADFNPQFDFALVYGTYTRPDLVGSGVGFNCCYEYQKALHSTNMDIDSGLWTLDGSITYLGNGWNVAYTIIDYYDPIAAENGTYRQVWWRERVTNLCVDGAPVTPPGSGWALYQNLCGTNGTAEWVREPVIAYSFGAITDGTCSGETPVAPVASCSGTWLLLNPSPAPSTQGFGGCVYMLFGATGTPGEFDAANGYPGPQYICVTSVLEEDYCRSRKVSDTLQRMLDTYGCPEVVEPASDFFEINPPGDAVGYAPGINYVTGQTNTLNHLMLLQASDAVYPNATEWATLGEMSLKQLLEYFRIMFQAYWYVNATGQLRIEHIDFFVQLQALDLTTAEALTWNANTNKYNHLSEAAPKRERMAYQTQRTLDVVGRDIVYPPACATAELKTETVDITADLAYVAADPQAINLESFVILATTQTATTPTELYEVIVDTGILLPVPVTNHPLAWSTLHDRYFRSNRYVHTGELNGQTTTFVVRPTIEQDELVAYGCCDIITWDGSGTVKTELGEVYLGKRQGVVQKLIWEDFKDVVTLTLRYSY